ncbi:MAG: hypothetical protein OQK11_11570 [Thiovulaceae bacterium]|nr:hypothetical protein [Sulfurimonadaceae bacterium]
MKYLKIILIVSMLILTPLNAANNKALAGGIVAGVALIAAMNANTESKCKAINYKNYTVGETMLASPANSIIDDKFDACISKVVLFTGNINNTESYNLDITQGQIVKTTKISSGYKIQFATTVVTPVEQLSGVKTEPLYVQIDEQGTIIKADSPLKNLIEKKLFKVTDKIVLKEKTFSQEIIYTGISGDELHFQYREYKGSTLRWPFTMNLIFDLKKSDIIKIKHYKIQILEANNTQIVYKVL